MALGPGCRKRGAKGEKCKELSLSGAGLAREDRESEGLLTREASRHTFLAVQGFRLFASTAGEGGGKKPAQNEFMVGTQEIGVDWLNDNSLSQCLNWGTLGYAEVTNKLPDLNSLTQQRFSFGSK